MKSISKIILISSILTYLNLIYARDVILIENLASKEEGLLLQNILIKKFHLPLELITLKNTTTPCESKSDAIVQLCLQENGELIIKKMNQYVVKNSLGVFLNQNNEDGESK